MTRRDCNACHWTGDEDECVWLGAVGPLCPMCHETTDTSDPPVRLCSARHGCHQAETCARHAAWRAHPQAPHIDASVARVPGKPCSLFKPTTADPAPITGETSEHPQ